METNFISSLGFSIANLRMKKLREKLLGRVEAKLMDDFLELLLKGMELAFTLSTSKGYRGNIQNFKGTYVFRTKKDLVDAAAIFENGRMRVEENPENITNWDVRVTFANPSALRRFLLSRNPDILNSLLKNEVKTEGNQNYIYKFGFMVEDLTQRFNSDGISAWIKNIGGLK